MKKSKPLFTIVTATRNRSRYLKILYRSLVLQSYKKIEWVVGNDGSTDKTDKTIRSFINEKKIKIKYIKSNIRIGKSKIDNLILPHASGEYLCYCGSDDYFKKDAFKNMSIILNKIPAKIKKKVNGVVTQSVDTAGVSQTFYKDKIPKKKMIVNWDEFTEYIKGDATMLEKTASYKNKKFKEVDFLISESSLIHKIYKNKLLLLSPLITKVMRRANDSISFGSSLKYSRGSAYSMSITFKKDKFAKLRFLKKMWLFINYWRYVWHGDIELKKAKKMWCITRKINLYYLLIPLCVILCIRDLLWKNIEKTHLEFEKNKNRAQIEYINF